MSFIEMNLTDVREPVVAPEGPANLTVATMMRYTKEDTKNDVIKLTLDINEPRSEDGGESYKRITHYLSFPGPNDDDDKCKTKMLMVKRFLILAGIQFSSEGWNEEDLYGATFDCPIEVEHNDQIGIDQNRLRVPFLDS